MARYREPLDPLMTPPDYRTFHPHAHPEAMKIAMRQTFEAMRPALEARFREIDKYYHMAKDAKKQCDNFMQRVKDNNMSWDGLDPEEYFKASQVLRFAENECELLAESILLTLDGALTTLVHELTGSDECLNLGELVCDNISLDRVLDGFGNYIRHRYEWKRRVVRGRKLKERQLTSIRPLATVIMGTVPADDEEAAAVVLGTRSPALAVLDVLTDYERDGESAAYGTLEQRLIRLSDQLIDARFSKWYEEKFPSSSGGTSSTAAAG